jgi:hypothetical protein
MPKATCNIGLPKISNNLPPTGHAPMDNPGLGMIRVEEVWGYSQTTNLNNNQLKCYKPLTGSRKFQKGASKKCRSNKYPRPPLGLITIA